MLKGSIVALVTPFHEDGTVNFEKLGELLDWQIENSTDGILILGTSGESSTMTHEEDDAVALYTIERVNHRVPVIVGAGSNCTQTALEKSLKYQNMGADALLLISPYYNKASTQGMIRHFTTVADAVHIPIILYNVPSRTGVNISPETCFELSKISNIVAIKEASGDISQVAKIAHLCGDNLNIYSGNDDQILPVLSIGGIGVISVLSNIAPKYTCEMVESFFEGNYYISKRMQLKALPLIKSLFSEVNPIPVKHALNLKGYNFGIPRLPLVPLNKEHSEVLEREMKEFGLI